MLISLLYKELADTEGSLACVSSYLVWPETHAVIVQTLSIIISLRVCGIHSEGFHLFVHTGVPVVDVHHFICMWVGDDQFRYITVMLPKKYLTLPTPVFCKHMI